MAPTLKPGVFLDDNPPKQRQFRSRRGHKMRPVIVVHTAENRPDLHGVDSGAENVANFIRTRTSYGSYHMIGDRDTIIRLQTNNLAVYHDTGSNNWSTSLSGAMQGVNWSTLSGDHRQQWVDCFVEMVVIQGRDLERRGVGLPEARLLTRREAHGGGSGFIGHGLMDPKRRTDPGKDFPWTEILQAYAKRVKSRYSPSSGSLSIGDRGDVVRVLQANLVEILGDDLAIDGDFGPATLQAVKQVQERLGVDRDGIVGPNTREAIKSAIKAQIEGKPFADIEQIKHMQRWVNSLGDRENIEGRDLDITGVVDDKMRTYVLDLRAFMRDKQAQFGRESDILDGFQMTIGDPNV